MKRKTITITVSRTKQVKQYEPLVVSVAEVVELEDGDDHKKVRRKVTEELVEAVENRMTAAMKELKAIK